MNVDDVIRTGRADKEFLAVWYDASTDYHYQPMGSYLVYVRDHLRTLLESGRSVTFETDHGDLEIRTVEELRAWMQANLCQDYRDRY